MKKNILSMVTLLVISAFILSACSAENQTNANNEITGKATSGYGLLDVKSTPPGAKIYVDNIEKGITNNNNFHFLIRK